jgi:phosphatidate cytidylyltransferase
MLLQRLLFGGLLIAGLLGLLYADDRLSAAELPALERLDGVLTTLVAAALVAACAREFGRLAAAAGHVPVSFWPGLAGIVLVLIPFLAHNEIGLGGVPEATLANELTLLWLVFCLVASAFLVARRRRCEGALAALSVTVFAVVYLGLMAQFIVRLRLFGPAGAGWLVLYFVASVKCADIGAYFTGLAIGRTRLIGWLSPKKTVEGFLGGVALSVTVSWLLARWLAGREDFATAAVIPGPVGACIFGGLMAVIGQAGDLLESLIKRDAQAKDSARAIPAFGGLLDVMDSLLPTAPLAYWFLLG